MPYLVRLILVFVLSAFTHPHAKAHLENETATQTKLADEPKLFDGIWKSVNDSFSGANLFLHLAGVTSTAALVKSGTDAHMYDTFKERENLSAWPGAFIVGSGVSALSIGSWLYITGRNEGNKESIGAAFAIAQSALIAVSYVSLLKAITGRTHPTNTSHESSQEQSEDFNFGFMRGGVSYGWPSGHATHTMAVTSALVHYYPTQAWLKWVSGTLSAYMIYTVSAHHEGQMHWFSDGIAGTLMGYTIGSSVGKNMRHRINGTAGSTAAANTEKQKTVAWMPIIGPKHMGVITSYNF